MRDETNSLLSLNILIDLTKLPVKVYLCKDCEKYYFVGEFSKRKNNILKNWLLRQELYARLNEKGNSK